MPRGRLTYDDVTITAATDGGDRSLVRNFTLTVERGEIVGLIGESGSGKTTVARATVGLLDKNVRVSGGSISIGDEIVHSPSVDRTGRCRGRHVGMIFQAAAASLDPTMIVRSQLREVLKVNAPGLGRQEVADKISTILTSMGFDDPERILRSYPHQLSGGMAQRVAIALATVSEPEFLIADECTSALDVTTQADVVGLLRKLSRSGIGIVFVTHDLLLARDICDRVAVMYQGDVVEVGSAEQVVDVPQHTYTRDLVSAVPNPFT